MGSACGHLPEFVARRVRWRLPAPPPSPRDARTPGSCRGSPGFFRGFQAISVELGKDVGEDDTSGARRQPECGRSSREPGFVVRVLSVVRVALSPSIRQDPRHLPGSKRPGGRQDEHRVRCTPHWCRSTRVRRCARNVESGTDPASSRNIPLQNVCSSSTDGRTIREAVTRNDGEAVRWYRRVVMRCVAAAQLSPGNLPRIRKSVF